MRHPTPPLSTSIDGLFERRLVVLAICMALIGYAFLSRIFALDAKVNVDAIWMWHDHTLRFWRGLSSGRWMDTFQHHPGVTFMWLSGLSMKASGTFGRPLSDAVLIAGKVPVVLVASLSVGATFLLVRRILGSSYTLWAALAAFLLASEPFAIGHARTFHLDMLVTSFGWCAALAGVVAAREASIRWGLLTGALLGLALLSKVSAAGIAMGVALVFCVEGVRHRSWAERRRLLACLLTTVALSALVVVSLWPALLFEPAKTASLFFTRVKGEFTGGHQLFSWGEVHTRDPGVGFYLGVLLFRTTPEVLVLAAIAVGCIVRLSAQGTELRVGFLCRYPVAHILLTHAIWLFIFLGNPKKQDRYFLTFLPILCLAAALALKRLWEVQWLQDWARRWKRPVLVLFTILGVLFITRTARVIAAHPVPLGWTSRLPLLSAERSVQLGIGEGLREVAIFIKNDVPRGVTPTLALYIYHRALTPWIRYRPVHHREAMYIIDYVCLRQRKREAKLIQSYTRGVKPLLVVRYGDVDYARLYPGPRHRSRQK
ncbi:MAG: hypothetical protein CSA65_08600 [Proteobacteria bacterium]|nr:MAG: hypothetical protein CSB49_06990 [Pseudomonadota bacterium]PIE17546.1 MAG: hypothetical protein CSA65_08600 [Pseudomonadota bacterium]